MVNFRCNYLVNWIEQIFEDAENREFLKFIKPYLQNQIDTKKKQRKIFYSFRVMRRNKISSLNENSFSSLQMLDELWVDFLSYLYKLHIFVVYIRNIIHHKFHSISYNMLWRWHPSLGYFLKIYIEQERNNQ